MTEIRRLDREIKQAKGNTRRELMGQRCDLVLQYLDELRKLLVLVTIGLTKSL